MEEIDDLHRLWKVLGAFLPDPLRPVPQQGTGSTVIPPLPLGHRPQSPTEPLRVGQGGVITDPLHPTGRPAAIHLADFCLPPVPADQDEDSVHGGVQLPRAVDRRRRRRREQAMLALRPCRGQRRSHRHAFPLQAAGGEPDPGHPRQFGGGLPLRDVGDKAGGQRPDADTVLAAPQLQALIEEIPALTYISWADPFGSPVYVSPQIKAMTGYTPAEWLADRCGLTCTTDVDGAAIALGVVPRV